MASAEIGAMSAIEEVFDELSDDERDRVLHWSIARYGTKVNAGRTVSEENGSADADYSNWEKDGEDGPDKEDEQNEEVPVHSPAFDHFAELFDHCAPTTAREKYLIAAYWLQIHKDSPSFINSKINALLRDQGHPLSRINDVAERLRKERPVPLNQISRGKSQQAKKVLKLSTAGMRIVKEMIANGHNA